MEQQGHERAVFAQHSHAAAPVRVHAHVKLNARGRRLRDGFCGPLCSSICFYACPIEPVNGPGERRAVVNYHCLVCIVQFYCSDSLHAAHLRLPPSKLVEMKQQRVVAGFKPGRRGALGNFCRRHYASVLGAAFSSRNAAVSYQTVTALARVRIDANIGSVGSPTLQHSFAVVSGS